MNQQEYICNDCMKILSEQEYECLTELFCPDCGGRIEEKWEDNCAAQQATNKVKTRKWKKEEWFVDVNGNETGPYSNDELKRLYLQSEIDEDTFICPKGSSDWRPCYHYGIYDYLIYSEKPTEKKRHSSNKAQHDSKTKSKQTVICNCPSCGKKIRIPLPPPSRKGTCKGCNSRFSISSDGPRFSLHIDNETETGQNNINSEILSLLNILDVYNEFTSSEEIKKAYKKCIREYHPDKTAHLGKELRHLAEFKTKEINQAFGQLKKLGIVS